MSLTLNNRPDLVEPAARLLLGAIDTGDRGTPEQRRILQMVITQVWNRPDIDIEAITPLLPEAVGEIFDDPIAARRVQMILVLLEVCRHPLTTEQVELVDAYALRLGKDDAGLELARGLVNGHRDDAIAHFHAVWEDAKIELSEETLRDRYGDLDTCAPELAAELRRMREFPRGTLGREYVEFYMEHNFQLPGEGAPSPAFFVSHDMTHLIAGYGPSGPEEVALSAFQLGMNDNEMHWVLFLLSLSAYEMAALAQGPVEFTAKGSILERSGAIELMIAAVNRGSLCSGDFSVADHLALAHLTIAEVRERFSVQPPNPSFPEFIS